MRWCSSRTTQRVRGSRPVNTNSSCRVCTSGIGWKDGEADGQKNTRRGIGDVQEETQTLGGESAKSDQAVTKAGSQISELQLESELLYFRKHFGLIGVFLHLGLGLAASIGTMLKRLLIRPKDAVYNSRIDNALGGLSDAKRSWRAFMNTSGATVPSR